MSCIGGIEKTNVSSIFFLEVANISWVNFLIFKVTNKKDRRDQ